MEKGLKQRIDGKVTLDGVTVAWHLSRWAYEDSTGDVESGKDNKVTISADSADLTAVGRALRSARRLEWARQSVHLCPASDARLDAVGLDDLGGVLLQIYRGSDAKSVVPDYKLAHIDPANYSDGGPEAVASVQWMRAVATAIRDAESRSGMHDAIYAAWVAAKSAVSTATA